MIKISKISLQQNSILLNFENPRHFYNIRKLFWFFLFYNVYKEKMFTIEIEDGPNIRYKNNNDNNTRKRINIL